MRIIVYGTGCRSKELLSYTAFSNKINILAFAETVKTKDIYYEKPVVNVEEIDQLEPFDYIVVATIYYRDIIYRLEQLYASKYRSKTIYYIDFLELIKECYPYSPYSSASTFDGCKFIYDNRDLIIGPYMKRTLKTFAAEEIEGFFDLVRSYYGEIKDNKWFIDIGANIGTTSIYVKKKNPNLKVLSIEPGKDTFCVLKANCILNNLEDIVCCNYAISSTNGTDDFHYIPKNPGASAIIRENGKNLVYAVTGVKDNRSFTNNEKVAVRSLPDVLDECMIDVSQVGCLWIDTQGFEAKIIEGSMPVIDNYDIPIFQEFSPKVYKTNGDWEMYKQNISHAYTYFIDFDYYCKGKKEPVCTDKLDELADMMEKEKKEFTNLFFIK